MKLCSKCNVNPRINNRWCKSCHKQYLLDNKDKIKEQRKQYRIKHREEISEKKKEYISLNKEKVQEQRKRHYINNADSIKEYTKAYRLEHLASVKEKNTEYFKNRRKDDPAFRLRGRISTFIRSALKSNGGVKNGSITESLPYTIQELKEHIEKQFEPWMTWDNHGIYNSRIWDDNNIATWTWQIDHIIPQSTFNYTSMEDQAFVDCWALSNLRPLSAKQNYLDGVRGNRH